MRFRHHPVTFFVNNKFIKKLLNYYCSEVVKKLMPLLPYFMLFSDAMPTKLDCGSIKPTSTATEVEFHDLKNRFLNDISTPMWIDKFITHRLFSFPSTLKIG